MGYIDKDKKIGKEITLRFTELGKKYLVDRNRDLAKITNYNLGDSDINYNTTQTDLEIVDFSGENNCADSSRFDLLKNEIFENGYQNSYKLLNTTGYGRITLNNNSLTQMDLSFVSNFLSYFTRFKINENSIYFNKADVIKKNTEKELITFQGEPYLAELNLLSINNKNSLGQGVQFKMFIGGNLDFIKIEYNNLRFSDAVYSGEVMYKVNIVRNKYYNLNFEKSSNINNSFNLFLNGTEISKKHVYNIDTEFIPTSQKKFGHLYSQGILECGRVFGLNRRLTFNEKKNGHLLTNNFIGNRYFDFQLTEGNGSLVSEIVSGNQNNILNLDWIV